jgi:hypothetical protein
VLAGWRLYDAIVMREGYARIRQVAGARGQPWLGGGGRQAHGTHHGRFGPGQRARLDAEGRKQAGELAVEARAESGDVVHRMHDPAGGARSAEDQRGSC